ncbi:hypothetical protein BJX96DRAFT_177131 [Aspergillus floccosus]
MLRSKHRGCYSNHVLPSNRSRFSQRCQPRNRPEGFAAVVSRLRSYSRLEASGLCPEEKATEEQAPGAGLLGTGNPPPVAGPASGTLRFCPWAKLVLQKRGATRLVATDARAGGTKAPLVLGGYDSVDDAFLTGLLIVEDMRQTREIEEQCVAVVSGAGKTYEV